MHRSQIKEMLCNLFSNAYLPNFYLYKSLFTTSQAGIKFRKIYPSVTYQNDLECLSFAECIQNYMCLMTF